MQYTMRAEVRVELGAKELQKRIRSKIPDEWLFVIWLLQLNSLKCNGCLFQGYKCILRFDDTRHDWTDATDYLTELTTLTFNAMFSQVSNRPFSVRSLNPNVRKADARTLSAALKKCYLMGNREGLRVPWVLDQLRPWVCRRPRDKKCRIRFPHKKTWRSYLGLKMSLYKYLIDDLIQSRLPSKTRPLSAFSITEKGVRVLGC
jgi:hypothetical protein